LDPTNRVGCRVMRTEWDYTWFRTGSHPEEQVVLQAAMETANSYGQNGWELVNFQPREDENGVFVIAMLKHPRT
jgi:hypothetical protein